MRKNARGVVVELVLPSALGVAGDHPRAMRQIVIFDGVVMERATTLNAQRKHWKAAKYGKGNVAALAVNDPSSWFGRWMTDHEKEGFVLYGKPFMVEVNEKEEEEINEGTMPRALVLRLDKARAEVGVVRNPWTGE